jgi:hypothetical protein
LLYFSITWSGSLKELRRGWECRRWEVFDDLIVEKNPPLKRVGKCIGGKEQHLTEAAVMLAHAEHLFRTMPAVRRIELHPDGEHAKQFDIVQWLSARGFVPGEKLGKTTYGGTYVRGRQTIFVQPKSGQGDVAADIGTLKLIAECKGGIVNTSHAGQVSRLRKGLCGVIGQLMQIPKGGRQVAVVPHTDGTLRLAQKLAQRAHDAGIEIALVDSKGRVTDVDPSG